MRASARIAVAVAAAALLLCVACTAHGTEAPVPATHASPDSALHAFPGTKQVPRYTVSLDDPPAQRWKALLADKGMAGAVKLAFTVIVGMLDSGGNKAAADTLINATTIPSEYMQEVQGLADGLGMSYRDVLIPQMYYELTAVVPSLGDVDAVAAVEGVSSDARDAARRLVADVRRLKECTSIVAQRSNGTVYHARNQGESATAGARVYRSRGCKCVEARCTVLTSCAAASLACVHPASTSPPSDPGIVTGPTAADYPTYMESFVIHVDFMRGGTLAYTATSFAGFVGIGGTAMAPGAWSWSINERDDDLPGSVLNRSVAAATAGGHLACLLARKTFDAGVSYAGLLQTLSTQPLINWVYYTIAGASAGQGAVITRNRTTAANVLPLGTAQMGGQSWYVLQTNDDNWKPPLDKRRQTGLDAMNAAGPASFNLTTMFAVLSVPPVYNADTIHTELVAPAWGEYITLLRVHNGTTA